MTTPRKRSVVPSSMTQAIDLAALNARVDANEQTIGSLSQTVNKVAEQVQQLSSISQVLTNASEGMTQHLVTIDQGLQRMMESRYELLDGIRKEASELRAKQEVMDSRLHAVEATNRQTGTRSFVLSNNAVGWAIATAIGFISLLSFLAQHWR